jgi:aryl-alcohol dehydrogenase-like predicted oxidoreductase
MVKLKEQGKIRAVGFSFWEKTTDTLPQVEPYLRSGVLEAVQVKISLLHPESVDNLIPVIRETGTAFVAREALAQGFLTDSFGPDGPFEPQDFKAVMPREEVEKRLGRANQFKFLVDECDDITSLPEAALNWTVSFPEISCVIPGSKTVAEIEQCLRAADAAHFSADQMARASAIHGTWQE